MYKMHEQTKTDHENTFGSPPPNLLFELIYCDQESNSNLRGYCGFSPGTSIRARLLRLEIKPSHMATHTLFSVGSMLKLKYMHRMFSDPYWLILCKL